ADEVAMATHGEMSGEFAVVRPLPRGHAVEMKIVAADRHRLSGLEFGNPLEAPLRLGDDAEERDPKPEMRKGGAPGRARQTARARECARERDPEQAGAFHDFGQRASHDGQGRPDRERPPERASAFHGEDYGDGDHGDAGGADKALSNAEQVAALPGKQWTKRHGNEERNEQRGEGRIEERRADGNFLARERLEGEW